MNTNVNKIWSRNFALFELGFRPFFIAAGFFAALAMMLWMLMYVFSLELNLSGLTSSTWHAHEMIFGYALAVVAGFLLTAVGNWTGVTMLRHWGLAALLILWLVARLTYFLPYSESLTIAFAADVLFGLYLVFSVTQPIIRVKQWRQLGIVAVLLLLVIANVLFYTGAMGHLTQGIYLGLFSGLYLVLALILILARRVMPFFIGRGVDGDFQPRNYPWVDKIAVPLFIVWGMLTIFHPDTAVLPWLSLSLCIVHGVRLYYWHTPGIWKKPLLWSLYVGYGFIVFGFLLSALSFWYGISKFLAVHAFAVGGLGMVTIAMMSRVSLGHTGRNVFDPPKILKPVFTLMVLGALSRSLLPLVGSSYYVFWMSLSQLLWVVAFLMFSMVYLRVLVRPRIDGRPG